MSIQIVLYSHNIFGITGSKSPTTATYPRRSKGYGVTRVDAPTLFVNCPPTAHLCYSSSGISGSDSSKPSTGGGNCLLGERSISKHSSSVIPCFLAV